MSGELPLAFGGKQAHGFTLPAHRLKLGLALNLAIAPRDGRRSRNAHANMLDARWPLGELVAQTSLRLLRRRTRHHQEYDSKHEHHQPPPKVDVHTRGTIGRA